MTEQASCYNLSRIKVQALNGFVRLGDMVAFPAKWSNRAEIVIGRVIGFREFPGRGTLRVLIEVRQHSVGSIAHRVIGVEKHNRLVRLGGPLGCEHEHTTSATILGRVFVCCSECDKTLWHEDMLSWPHGTASRNHREDRAGNSGWRLSQDDPPPAQGH